MGSPWYPPHLQSHWNYLIKALKGFACIDTSMLDWHIWACSKKNTYTILARYDMLIQNFPNNPLDQLWNRIWNKYQLPKINLFCWELVHGKVLTMENLRKWNIHGPSRCILCEGAKENIPHVFRHCVYGWNCSYSIMTEISQSLEFLLIMEWKSFKYLGIQCKWLGGSSVEVYKK